MKKIIFERFKLTNAALFITVSVIVFGLYLYVSQGYCIDNCSLDIKKGILNPIYLGGKWLAGILGILILLPSYIFKKWLFFVLPIPLVVTYWLVQDISVYSGGVLYISRAQMAENGMIALAVITLVFVIVHLIYDWKKKQ